MSRGGFRENAGRPKGSPNKVTALLKDAVIKAAEEVGEDGNGSEGLTGYCKRLADKEPKAFAALLGRILPMQLVDSEDNDLIIEVTIGGEPAKT